MKSFGKYAGMAMVALVIASSVAWAQGQGGGRGGNQREDQRQEQSAGDKVREVLPASEPVFTTAERTVITRWFTTNEKRPSESVSTAPPEPTCPDM